MVSSGSPEFSPLCALASGPGWQAVWTFIAILAGVRTLGEVFRHGWSDLVVIGLFSLVVAVDVPAGDVLDAVRTGAGPLLEYARLVDDYRGTGVDEGQKSLTFALRFRATDRTLTAAEASEARDGAVRRAGERFGATLRD